MKGKHQNVYATIWLKYARLYVHGQMIIVIMTLKLGPDTQSMHDRNFIGFPGPSTVTNILFIPGDIHEPCSFHTITDTQISQHHTFLASF